MATQIVVPAKSESLRTASMPRQRTASWAAHSARKPSQPMTDRPRNVEVPKSAVPGATLTSRSMTAADARKVWIPYQATATIARRMAGMLAPYTPNEIRAKTGNGTPTRCPATPIRLLKT